MAVVSLKCPSCGANVAFDDEREYCFCTYCGSQIRNDAIKKLKIEYSGDPMSTTNVSNVVRIEKKVVQKPGNAIPRPRIVLLIVGALFIALAIMFTSVGIRRDSVLAWFVAGFFAVVGTVTLINYIMSARRYSKAVNAAIRKQSEMNDRQ